MAVAIAEILSFLKVRFLVSLGSSLHKHAALWNSVNLKLQKTLRHNLCHYTANETARICQTRRTKLCVFAGYGEETLLIRQVHNYVNFRTEFRILYSTHSPNVENETVRILPTKKYENFVSAFAKCWEQLGIRIPWQIRIDFRPAFKVQESRA